MKSKNTISVKMTGSDGIVLSEDPLSCAAIDAVDKSGLYKNTKSGPRTQLTLGIKKLDSLNLM